MTNDKNPNFDNALKSLEKINERLESGNLEIEEALRLYKEGVDLYRICQKKLKEAKVVFREIGGEN